MKYLSRIFGIITILLFMLTLISCKKKPTIPTVSTSIVSNITQTTAVSGGNVTNDGSAAIVERGICWNTSSNPTIANNRTIEGGAMGSYTNNLTQLSPNTLYYVRAYATNEIGTGYGNQVTFTTSQVALATLTTTAATSI